jgi:hypothetical protein
MKVLLGMVVVMLLAGASTCRADSFLSVNFLPTTFDLEPDRSGVSAFETVGATFKWDITTGVLSDFQVTAEGPWSPGSFTPGLIMADGTHINFINLVDAAGNIFQFNPGNHGGAIPPLPAIPGTYETDLWFGCASHCGQDFMGGTAVITAAAEPATGLLVGLGLAVAGLMRRRRKKVVDPAVWENLG